MAKKMKKVILLIVEGNSDEEFLSGRLHELYRNHNVLFDVVNGDIFTQISNQNVKAILGKRISDFCGNRKFRKDDILAILHITDTDGVFIDETRITVDIGQEKLTQYNEIGISVCNEEQKRRTIKRNELKSSRINGVFSARKINEVPYKIYYFSTNLEHVLFDEQNPDDRGKVEAIDNFIDVLSEPIEKILQEFLPQICAIDTEGKYTESWKYIQQESNSVKRSTNVPLLFDFIDERVRE